MGAFRYIGDTLRNFVANLGTSRDKGAASHYVDPCPDDNELMAAYRGGWLARKIVEIPAKDACRRWRAWNASKEQISAIEAEEKRLAVRGRILQAMILARLFGGAAVYIGTGPSDPSKPLRPEEIKRAGIRQLTVLTRRVLSAKALDQDIDSPYYGQPASYTLTTAAQGTVDIHPSRLVRFIGAANPDEELATNTQFGWGDSVLTAKLDAIKQADATAANVASLIFEKKIDVINIPNFMASMADPQYEAQMLARMRLAMVAKGINGALLLDKEETYTSKSAETTGLDNMIMAFVQLASGAADIPMTRLLGQSPGGLNASGDSDMRNYYDHVSEEQELCMTPAMAVLDECLIHSALGTRPPEVFYGWSSLWQTSDTERATIGKTNAETIKTLADTRLFPEQALSQAAVNMLIESGTLPGLEAAIEEFGSELPGDEGADGEDADEQQAAAAAAATLEATDAKPRTLYVHRKVLNAADLIAWAKSQGFATTLPADDLHVTIAFSRTPVDWMKAGQAWSDDKRGTLTVSPGGARLVEKFDGGAVVLLFNASELSWRHEAIKEAGASWDWPDYQPHITLTYAPGDVDVAKVTPYRGAIELGPEIFEELDETWRDRVTEE